MKEIVHGSRVYTDTGWLNNCSITIENGRVINLQAEVENTVVGSKGHPYVVPAFTDLQIYGAGGRLLSEFPDVETLEVMYEYCRAGGCNFFLPTISTNDPDILPKAIDAIKQYWKKGGKGVLGLHVEGPWISVAKRGAHLEKFIHSPSVPEVRELMEAGKSVIKIVTLDPEVCSDEVIQILQKSGVVIAAGHSNMSFELANNYFSAGISLATHLFNAMPSIHHRDPGLAAAVMLHPDVYCSIVPDGYHVDFNVIRLAKKLMGDRLFMITDAVTSTTTGPYRHELRGDKYMTGETLSGSCLTMLKGVQNCIHECGMLPEQAIDMASGIPAKIGGLENVAGKISVGYPADFLALDENFNLVKNYS